MPSKTPAPLISKQQPLPIHHSHCLISRTQGAPTPRSGLSSLPLSRVLPPPHGHPPPYLFCSPDWGMGQACLAETSRRFWALVLAFKASSKHYQGFWSAPSWRWAEPVLDGGGCPRSCLTVQEWLFPLGGSGIHLQLVPGCWEKTVMILHVAPTPHPERNGHFFLFFSVPEHSRVLQEGCILWGGEGPSPGPASPAARPRGPCSGYRQRAVAGLSACLGLQGCGKSGTQE